jgi:hypothetical protein
MQSANYLKIFSFFSKRIIEIIGLLTVLLSIFFYYPCLLTRPKIQILYFQKKRKYKIYLDFMEALHQIYFYNHLE